MIHGLYDGKLPNGGNPDGIFLTSGKIMQSRYIRNGKFYAFTSHILSVRKVLTVAVLSLSILTTSVAHGTS